MADHGGHLRDPPVAVVFRIPGGAGVLCLGRMASLFEAGPAKA